MTSRVLSRRAIIAAAGLGAVAMLAAIPNAHADAGPDAAAAANPVIEVIVIIASQNDGGGDDPRIATLPDLKQAPLKFFASRKLIEKPQVNVAVGTDGSATSKFLFTFALERGKPVAIAVNDGPTMNLTLADVLTDDNKPPRYNINAELKSNGASSKIGVVLSRHQRVFVGGPTWQSGTLFFGVRAKS